MLKTGQDNDMFKTTEELLNYPTPFWLRDNEGTVLCLNVGWKKGSTAIAISYMASYAYAENGMDCIVYDFKHMPAIMSYKWNKQEVIERPDPEGLHGIIKYVFTDY